MGQFRHPPPHEHPLGIAAVHRHLAGVIHPAPARGPRRQHSGLHGPLVVVDRAVAIQQMAHEVEGAVAPVDAAEMGEEAGADRPAAEVELLPAPFGQEGPGGGIDEGEAGVPLAPGPVELLLGGAETLLLGGIEPAPEGAQLQLGQVAEALGHARAPAQAAHQLLPAAPQGRLRRHRRQRGEALPRRDHAELEVGTQAGGDPGGRLAQLPVVGAGGRSLLEAGQPLQRRRGARRRQGLAIGAQAQRLQVGHRQVLQGGLAGIRRRHRHPRRRRQGASATLRCQKRR